MLDAFFKDEELEQDDEYTIYDGDLASFTEELKTLARVYITKFFADKSFHCGGKVPASIMFSEASLNMVVSTPFEEGIDLCHHYLKYIQPPAKANQYPINWQVVSVIKMLKQVQKVGIPREMQAGLMLLYLKICKGISVEERPLNVMHIFG